MIRLNKRFIIMAASLGLLLLILFIILYEANIIFVKEAEHGVLTKRFSENGIVKYQIYLDGNPHTFTLKDSSLILNTGVVNFKYRNDRIVKFVGYVEPFKEKVMSRSTSTMEFEYSGTLGLSDKYTVYTQDGENLFQKNLSSIVVGAVNIRTYKDAKGSIKTIIADGDTTLDFMRVGIKTQGFSGFGHEKVEFISNGTITLIDKKDTKQVEVPAKTKVTFLPSKEGISVETPGISETFKNRVYIMPQDDMHPISMLSFKRGYGTPSYRGYFEITQNQGALRMINEVNIENYLYQVVPSEMPASFGLEALKAQAVAARTYAVSDLLSGRYAKEGFHVDDSTMSQVYNNSEENSLASQAVNDTKGIVMKYDGMLVDAKYTSTAHGYGANSNEIWASNGEFPGKKTPYLTARSYLLNKKKYDLSKEETAKEFFKDWTLESYDSTSPYFRWKVTLSGEELKNTIEKNLPKVYMDQKDYILTLSGDKYESKEMPSNCIGDLKDIYVERRGGGGNIMDLVVSGTNGTYKIQKELNVRYVLRPRKSDTLSEGDVLIKRIKGSDLKNANLLPSAFMVFDILKDDSGLLTSATIYGGGYGHGTGMSQYGAGYLASKGYKFNDILTIYYTGVTLDNLY